MLYTLAFSINFEGSIFLNNIDKGNTMAKFLHVVSCFALFLILLGTAFGQEVVTEPGHKKFDTICSRTLPTHVKLDSVMGNGYQSFSYLVTNGNNQLLKVISKGDRLMVKDTNISQYRVWGIAYNGKLASQPGMNVNQVTATKDDTLSPDFLEIQKNLFDGGRIKSPKAINGVIEACYSSATVIRFQPLQYKPSDAKYQFIITDFEQDTVKAVPSGNQFDIQKLGVGYFKVVGIVYKGQLKNVKAGELVSKINASKCWAFSQNTITINQGQVDGGQIQSNDFKGDTLRLCKSKDFGSIGIEKETKAAGDVSYRYVVTGSENDTIVRTPINDRLNFDQNGIGKWHVKGLSYQGVLQNYFAGSRLKEVRSTGCINFSDNHFTIRKDSLDVNAVSVNGEKDSLIIPQTREKALKLDATSKATKGADLAYLATSRNKDTLLRFSRDNRLDPGEIDRKVFYLLALSYIGKLNSPQHNQLVDSLSLNYKQWSPNKVKVIKKDESTSYLENTTKSLDLKVYPNPAQDFIHVRLSNKVHGDKQLKLLNTVGKTFKTVSLDKWRNNVVSLDLGDLPAGAYFLRVERQGKQPLHETVILR